MDPDENRCALRLSGVIVRAAFVVPLVECLRFFHVEHLVQAYHVHSANHRWICYHLIGLDSFVLYQPDRV